MSVPPEIQNSICFALINNIKLVQGTGEDDGQGRGQGGKKAQV